MEKLLIFKDRFKPAFIEAIPDEQQGPSHTQPEQTINLKLYLKINVSVSRHYLAASLEGKYVVIGNTA